VEFRAVNNGKPHSRIACISSKYTIPKAVDRHDFKRMVYSAFLQYKAQGNPQDIIIRPGSRWKEDAPTKAMIKDSVLQILKNLGI
jgi:ribonuclease P protein component